MTLLVRSERVANCPFSVAAEYAVNFLKSGSPDPNQFTVRLPFSAFGLPLRGALQRAVTLSFGVHYEVGYGARGIDEIRFSWRARSRALPDLVGVLHLSIATHATTGVVLTGTYEPPFGPLGALFDAAIGKRFAAATADDFVARVCNSLETEEAIFRRAHPPAS